MLILALMWFVVYEHLSLEVDNPNNQTNVTNVINGENNLTNLSFSKYQTPLSPKNSFYIENNNYHCYHNESKCLNWNDYIKEPVNWLNDQTRYESITNQLIQLENERINNCKFFQHWYGSVAMKIAAKSNDGGSAGSINGLIQKGMIDRTWPSGTHSILENNKKLNDANLIEILSKQRRHKQQLNKQTERSLLAVNNPEEALNLMLFVMTFISIKLLIMFVCWRNQQQINSINFCPVQCLKISDKQDADEHDEQSTNLNSDIYNVNDDDSSMMTTTSTLTTIVEDSRSISDSPNFRSFQIKSKLCDLMPPLIGASSGRKSKRKHKNNKRKKSKNKSSLKSTSKTVNSKVKSNTKQINKQKPKKESSKLSKNSIKHSSTNRNSPKPPTKRIDFAVARKKSSDYASIMGQYLIKSTLNESVPNGSFVKSGGKTLLANSSSSNNFKIVPPTKFQSINFSSRSNSLSSKTNSLQKSTQHSSKGDLLSTKSKTPLSEPNFDKISKNASLSLKTNSKNSAIQIKFASTTLN